MNAGSLPHTTKILINIPFSPVCPWPTLGHRPSIAPTKVVILFGELSDATIQRAHRSEHGEDGHWNYPGVAATSPPKKATWSLRPRWCGSCSQGRRPMAGFGKLTLYRSTDDNLCRGDNFFIHHTSHRYIGALTWRHLLCMALAYPSSSSPRDTTDMPSSRPKGIPSANRSCSN